jgi:hypothetical protein
MMKKWRALPDERPIVRPAENFSVTPGLYLVGMNETHSIQQLLSETGIQFEELFTGEDDDCPVCKCSRQLAA